jgi:phage-related baseplate assembly protein
MTALTTDEVKQAIYDVLAQVGVDTTSWKPGAVERTRIAGESVVIAATSILVAELANGGFLETAEGDWLTLVAKYVYGEDRVLASFAPGEVTLTNTGGGVYDEAAGDVLVMNTATGKTYRTTEDLHLGVGDTVTIGIVATEAGSASTSIAGAIDAISSPSMTGVTCTNALAVVGDDDESDALLKTRCSEKLGSLSPNGPWDAYSFVARNTKRADGSSVDVTRVRTTKDGYGNVAVFLATDSGEVSGTADDPTTDLGAISLAIQTSAVPLAVTANVYSAEKRLIDVTYQVWLYSNTGRTTAQVTSAIYAALLDFMKTRPIGGDVISGTGAVYVSAIEGVIKSAFPNDIFRVVVSLPAGDVPMEFFQVPVLGTVTPTVTFVAGSY